MPEELHARVAADWVHRNLGVRLSDAARLSEALTHRSLPGPNYERLEFLGDAVLAFVVAELLFERHPAASEGDLSRLRASLVNGEVLGSVALALGLGDVVRLGEGELKSGGFRRQSILADTLEALLGAVYLELGMSAAREVIDRLLGERIEALPPAAALKDPKTRLQEYLQARGMALPLYRVDEIMGEPHARSFRVSCELPELGLSSDAAGSSRKRAEQQAAETLLRELGSA